jgi:hypothetical protein
MVRAERARTVVDYGFFTGEFASRAAGVEVVQGGRTIRGVQEVAHSRSVIRTLFFVAIHFARSGRLP